VSIKTPRRKPKHNSNNLIRYGLKLFVLIGFLGLILGIFGGAWYYASHCSWFCLRSIEVRGEKHLNIKEIIKLSKLKLFKDNLLRIDASEVSKRILRNPWIKEAKVEKDFPDKIIITIKERTPIALLNLKGNYFLIDIKGVLIAKVSPSSYKHLPILSIKVKEPISGSSIASIASSGLKFLELSKKARTFINTIYPILCLDDIRKIIIKPESLIVYLRGGDVPIIFSKSYDLKKQFVHAQKVLCYLYRSGKYSQTLEIRLDYAPDKVWAKLKRS